MHVFPPRVIDRDGLHRSNLARPPRGALGVPAGRRLPRRRLPARPDRAAAPRGRRRRREERRDRGRVDRREGDARPLHAPRSTRSTRIRLRLARRLHHARPLGGRPRARPVRDPPPLVPGALLLGTSSRRATVGPPSAARVAALPAARLPHPRHERLGGRQRGRRDRAARPEDRLLRGQVEVAARASATRSRWSARRRSGGSGAPRRHGSPRPELRGLEVRFDVVTQTSGG